MLLQPRKGYRAGLDAVLLAAAAPVGDAPGRASRVLDVGAGAGTVGLCVAARAEHARVTLLERDPTFAELAGRNASRNGLHDRVHVMRAALLAADLPPESFDHVLANPPYHAQHAGTRSARALKDVAHAMEAGDLDRWGRFLARMAAPGGSATLVHKAEALGDLLAALEGRFGAIKVLPVLPRPDEPASRIIVQGRKGSRGPLTLLAPLVVHEAGNAFTARANAILRQGAGLPL